MDRSLDEITRERNTGGRRQGGRDRRSGNGVGKLRYDSNANWVHDKYDDGPSSGRRERRPPPPRVGETSKLKVENLHYDLTEDDLRDLFEKVGPVKSVSLKYDRAGRSEGIAFVTYEKIGDAEAAIRKYDGELACGQPIHLSLHGQTVAPAPRSLAERISGLKVEALPLSRSKASTIDRYVPGESSNSTDTRDREPREPREARDNRDNRGGRPPRRDRRNSPIRDGGRRGRNGGGGGVGGRGRGGRGGEPRERRHKKTAEDLDAEMDDYFAQANLQQQGGDAAAATGTATAVKADADGDAEMAE